MRVGSVSTRVDNAIASALFAVEFQIAIQRWSYPNAYCLASASALLCCNDALALSWLIVKSMGRKTLTMKVRNWQINAAHFN